MTFFVKFAVLIDPGILFLTFRTANLQLQKFKIVVCNLYSCYKVHTCPSVWHLILKNLNSLQFCKFCRFQKTDLTFCQNSLSIGQYCFFKQLTICDQILEYMFHTKSYSHSFNHMWLVGRTPSPFATAHAVWVSRNGTRNWVFLMAVPAKTKLFLCSL